MKRRNFLESILGFLIALIGGKLILDFLKFSVNRRKTVKIAIKHVRDYPTVIDGLILWKDSTGLNVFSSHCTHLGCIIKFDKNKGIFECPCHGSRFDLNGQVIHGPARSPLKKLDYTVIDGKIFVSL